MFKSIICFFNGHDWERIKKTKKEKEYKSPIDPSNTTVMKNLSGLFKKPRLRCKRCGVKKKNESDICIDALY